MVENAQEYGLFDGEGLSYKIVMRLWFSVFRIASCNCPLIERVCPPVLYGCRLRLDGCRVC